MLLPVVLLMLLTFTQASPSGQSSSTFQNGGSNHSLNSIYRLPRLIAQKVNDTVASNDQVLITKQGTGGTGGGGGATGGNTGSGSGTGGSLSGLATTLGVIGAAVVIIKGGMAFFLSILKLFIIPGILTIFLLALLAGGSVFFLCAITDCQGRLGTAIRPGAVTQVGGGGRPTMTVATESDGATTKLDKLSVNFLESVIEFADKLEGSFRDSHLSQLTRWNS